MDIDFMKSGVDQDHIEIMLMQMEKLPDFSGSYSDQIPEFTGSNTLLENMHVSSPAFRSLQQPSTVSFSGDPSTFMQPVNFSGGGGGGSEKRSSMAAMREMIFRIAAMQPIHIDPEVVKPPKRRNVKISTDPQSVAARHRRERISERIRILQRLVPGGTKMDTASMLDEAIHYVKFLKKQVQSLERVAANRSAADGIGFPVPMSSGSYFQVVGRGYDQSSSQNVQHLTDA